MAREVVEAYGLDIGAHPVGTGPYMLGEYRRSARIVLLANPDYRDVTYVPAGPMPAASQAVANALKGRKLPLAGRVEIRIIEEGQARWLAFPQQRARLSRHPPHRITPTRRSTTASSRPNLAAQGIVHDMLLRPNICGRTST